MLAILYEKFSKNVFAGFQRTGSSSPDKLLAIFAALH